MKTNTPKFRLRTVCTGISFLVLSMLASFATAQTGENDPTFNPFDNAPGQGANNPVSVAAVQPDNKTIIAGTFTAYNGTTVNRLARLNIDGSLDNSFNAGSGADATISAIAFQPNDKILIGGNFLNYNGVPRTCIARLNANGSLDNSFNPGVGPNDGIFKIITQPNGKILIAGTFTTYNSIPVRGIVRLNKNGSLDDTFHAIITDTLTTLHDIALQPDGKIVVGGIEKIYEMSNSVYFGAIRLNKNGDRDFTFKRTSLTSGDIHPYISSIGIENDGNILLAISLRDAGSSVPYHGYVTRFNKYGIELESKSVFWINSMMIQPDGKIIFVGFADEEWFIIKRKVIRMNKDLSIDSTFLFDDKRVFEAPSESGFYAMGLQQDGKIVIGGHFFEINGLIANNIARLNANGNFDITYNQRSGSNGTILSSAAAPGGKTLIGGEFSKYNYQLTSNIARLKKNGELDPSFNVGTGVNGPVHTIALQSNGKVLIGGNFTAYNGNSCRNIARLNSDGSFDNSFRRTVADNVVRKIKIDRNGKIILAGDFKNVNGMPKEGIARLLTNGTLDNTFNTTISIDKGGAYDFIISQRGQIYLAVILKNTLTYTYKTDVIRLNRNGSTDGAFIIPEGRFYEVHALAFNNDGKILAGGLGHYPASIYTTKGMIVQLNTDGSTDSTAFNYERLEAYLNLCVRTIDVLENDKIVIGGDFSYKDVINHIGLLTSIGSIDAGFIGNANNHVYTTALTGDKMIVGGVFSEYTGIVRNSIARINVAITEKERFQQQLISQPLNDSPLSVYPNPAISSIHVDNLQPGSVLKIVNAIGKEVHAEMTTKEKSTIELSDYSNGVYFIIVENNGNRTTAKFVVSK
jgi:uncharacterized delta-60 repeat protein